MQNTSDGRIDLLIESPKFRYVMEFLLGQASQSAERKLDGTAEEALEQIKQKDYALPFTMDDKQTFLIGMNFDSETRNIERWVVE